MLTAVADGRRRAILLTLRDRPAESALRVPEGVHDGTMALEQLQADLHHNHLPLLARHEFIDWDRERHQVTRGSAFEQLQPLLEVIEQHTAPLADEQ